MQESFTLLNNYYDKIYVLTVEAADERRKLFTERFIGLHYSFFYGADKNNFTVEEVIENGTYSEKLSSQHHRYNKKMKIGEIACAWSHKMIYEDMLKKNYNHILIFEDDAVPAPDIMNRLSSVLTEIPDDCELLMWSWSKNGDNDLFSNIKKSWYHIQHTFGLLKMDHTIINNLFAKPYSKHLKKAGFHDFTTAYSINSSAASKFLKMQTPIQYIADNLLAYSSSSQQIKGYIVYPAIFIHDTLTDGTPRDSYIR